MDCLGLIITARRRSIGALHHYLSTTRGQLAGTNFVHEIPEGVEVSNVELTASDSLPIEFTCETAADNTQKLVCNIGTFNAGRVYMVDIQVAAASPKMKYTFTSTLSTTDADSSLTDNANLSKFGVSTGMITLMSGLALFARRARILR